MEDSFCSMKALTRCSNEAEESFQLPAYVNTNASFVMHRTTSEEFLKMAAIAANWRGVEMSGIDLPFEVNSWKKLQYALNDNAKYFIYPSNYPVGQFMQVPHE